MTSGVISARADRKLPPTSFSALALVLALTILHTWPLATAPGSLSRNDNADTMLNEWIVAWVAHQLPRAPMHLFDANIFYPEPNTLAFSEHLAVPAVMIAPALWAGASPVLAYNLLVLAGFTLTAWAVWFVVWRWTDDWLAGIAAGSIAAFNAHTLTRLPHVQALHWEFLPLALLAADRLVSKPRPSTAWWLALWFTLQALTSNYLLVFTLVALGIAMAVRAPEWTRDAPRLARALALPCLAAAIAIAPFLLPYLRAQRSQGLSRSLEEVAMYSASWRDYVATAGRMHYALWSARFLDGATALFPGVAALLLAIAAVAPVRPPPNEARTPLVRRSHGEGGLVRRSHGEGGTRGARRALIAIALAGALLSFGPALPGYALLYRLVPLLQGIRGAARFGQLALFALALLAGFGAASLRARFPGRAGTSLVCALIVLAHIEALRAPFAFTPFAGIPRIYLTLADDPGARVVEFPIPAPEAFQDNAEYVLNSTRHWRPLVNGYSGHVPASYVEHYQALRVLPDPRAIDMLHRLGITHIVIHEAAFVELKGREVYDAVLRAQDLETTTVARDIRIMRVR